MAMIITRTFISANAYPTLDSHVNVVYSVTYDITATEGTKTHTLGAVETLQTDNLVGFVGDPDTATIMKWVEQFDDIYEPHLRAALDKDAATKAIEAEKTINVEYTPPS